MAKHCNPPPLARREIEQIDQRRDALLEADRLYVKNVRSLQRRRSIGKISATGYRNIQHWLLRAALRRAGLALREANGITPLQLTA